jgi:ribosomal protein S18 acetylase RimI-like enzyme
MRAWADAAGDRELVLQVMADNAPGRALYDRLGFTRSHGYHYRRSP